MKKHREPAEDFRLKSVTVSMEPSGKYFASLLYEGYSCENQAAEQITVLQRYLELIMQCREWQCFQKRLRRKKQVFSEKMKKGWRGSKRKLSRCVRGSHNYELQKKKVARCHEKIRNQKKRLSAQT